MHNEYINFFISNFIKKRYQERLRFEFESPKKRDKVMNRFCHNTISLLREDRIIYSDKTQFSFNRTQLKEKVLVIDMTKHIQGLECSLNEALQIINEEYMATLIIGKDFVYIKEELMAGEANIYLLKI